MANNRDFNNLTFSLYKDVGDMKMYESDYRNGNWDDGRIVPFRNIELSPAANILNYGQGIFEGMKAYRTVKNNIVMFRPDENGKRFLRSLDQMALPAMTLEKFEAAVLDVVKSNHEFVPPSTDGRHSMYLRPLCIATEAMLGVKAAKECLFLVYASPVGPYYPGIGVVRLLVTSTHRAASRGSGDAKAVSNYPVTMRPREEAIKAGFDGALFLDTRHDRYVEEAGAANVFALMEDDTLVTPKLGSILPGITRASLLHLAADKFGMKVKEVDLDIEDFCLHAKECFLTGTGATITSVSEVSWKGKIYNINKNDFQLAHKLYNTLIGIQLEQEEDPYGWITKVMSL